MLISISSTNTVAENVHLYIYVSSFAHPVSNVNDDKCKVKGVLFKNNKILLKLPRLSLLT